MQQVGRRFSPDLLAIPAGPTVSFPDTDLIFHNVFYTKGESRSVVFPKPGIVSVNCHLDPNMAAIIVVTPNHWLARADRSGHIDMDDVPPGRYTVVV